MDKTIKKYCSYCIEISKRSWGYSMKLLNINTFVRQVVVAGIILIIVLIFIPWSTSLSEYWQSFSTRINFLGWVAFICLICFVFTSLFITPFLWVDELDGLKEPSKIEKYSSPIGNDSSYSVGLKIDPNRPTAVNLYAILEEAFMQYEDGWKPYTAINIGSKIRWANTGHANDEQVAYIARGDCGRLSLFKIHNNSAVVTLKDEDHQLWFMTSYKFKVSIHGTTRDGKDIITEYRYIRFSNTAFDFEILNNENES
jgi:hypothetical protein